MKEVSREGAKTRRDPEELSAIVVDCAYHLHVEVGPGLLESVYEVVLARMLEDRGLAVRRQVSVLGLRMIQVRMDKARFVATCPAKQSLDSIVLPAGEANSLIKKGVLPSDPIGIKP